MNDVASIGVQPLTTATGAVLSGIDIGQPLSPEAVARIRQAVLDHGVIFLRDQHCSIDAYWDFMAHFGVPLKDETTGTEQDTADLVMTADFVHARKGTAVWHADTTSLARPPWATALRAVSVPEYGGDTCWSHAAAAWEALSPPLRRMLDGLTAVHSIRETFTRMGEFGPGFDEKYSSRHVHEQVHPVVLTHPETGRKTLYVSESFTTRIVELSQAESDAILAILLRHIQRPDFCLRWKWAAGDLAFWDNRIVQHYAVPDYTSARIMQRIVLQGERPGGEMAPRDIAASAA